MPPPESTALEPQPSVERIRFEAEDDKLIASATSSPRHGARRRAALSDYEPSASRRLAAVIYCVCYLIIGPTLIVVNRHILKELRFNYPMCLSGLGLLFTSTVCVAIVGSGGVVLEHRERVTRQFALKNLLPVGAAMACTLSFGNAVYLHLPVGYIQMLKAFTPTVTLTLLWLSGIETPSRRVTLSVAGICVGTSLASLGEGSLTALGLLIMLSAEVSEAVRLVLAQKLLQNLKMGVIEGQYWMAPISAVCLFGAAALAELPAILRTKAYLIPLERPLYFALAASLGFCVNMCAFLVIKSTGSVMLKVLGTARNAGLVVFGVLVYGERLSPLELFGYGCSLASFAAYNYYKMKDM